MEPDRDDRSGDGVAGNAAGKQQNESQDTAAKDDAPIVLPIVLVPTEETGASEAFDQAANVPDRQSADSHEVVEADDARAPLSSDAAALGTAARELLDQSRARREFQLPLPAAEGDVVPPHADLSVESAIEHLRSLTVDAAGQSRAGDHASSARAIGRREARSPTDIVRGPYRPEDQDGPAITLLGAPSGSDSPASHLDRASQSASSPGDASDGESRGRVPTLNAVVQLADARALFEECLEAVAEKNAPKYREIAASEVKQGFWEYGNQRRAADYRLRGPH